MLHTLTARRVPIRLHRASQAGIDLTLRISYLFFFILKLKKAMDFQLEARVFRREEKTYEPS